MKAYAVVYTVEFLDKSQKTHAATMHGDNCIEVEKLLVDSFKFYSTVRLVAYRITPLRNCT